MRSVNRVMLIGNLTRDPEIKQTTTGQTIVTFGIATNREWVTANGEKKSLAEFHNIVVWGRLATICAQYLKKGKLIYIEGYLKTRSWDSPEGVRIFKTEIVAQDMIMLNKRVGNDHDSDLDFSANGSDVASESSLDDFDDNVFDPESGFTPEED